MQKEYTFHVDTSICKIVEKTKAKMKNLENLKMNFSKYQYPKQLTEFGINKALSIPLQEVHTPEIVWNDNSLPFITICNPNSPDGYEMIDRSIECLTVFKTWG